MADYEGAMDIRQVREERKKKEKFTTKHVLAGTTASNGGKVPDDVQD
jgi:hypothetical protein